MFAIAKVSRKRRQGERQGAVAGLSNVQTFQTRPIFLNSLCFLTLTSSSFLTVLTVLTFVILAGSTPASADEPAKMSPSGWVEDEAEPPVSIGKDASGKPVLRAGVKHSVQLPSLPERLRTGSIFNEKEIPQINRDGLWYMIPDWLAGRWLRSEETILSTYYFDSHRQVNEPRTIALREMADFGVQRDRLGHVWHYRLATRGLADKGSILSVAVVQSQEPVEVTENEVIIRDVFTELQVNQSNGIIIQANQAESISRYTPVKDGVMTTNVSIKFFQEDGSPDRQQSNVSTERRIDPFAPTNAYKGMDLRQSFTEFLKANDKSDLVPVR